MIDHGPGNPQLRAPCALLLTGATGFLGGQTLQVLLRTPRRICVLVRGDGGQERMAQRLPLGAGTGAAAQLDVVPGDVTLSACGLGPQEREQLRDLDQLVHVAGVPWSPDQTRSEVLLANQRSAVEAARLARTLGLRRMVLVSSACLGGLPGETVPEGPLPVRETFRDGFEESKLRAEWEVAHLLEGSGVALLVVRPTLLINAQDTGFVMGTNLLGAIWEALHTLDGQGSQPEPVRACVPAGCKHLLPVDQAAAALAALVDQVSVDGYVNLVGEQSLDQRQLFEYCVAARKLDLRIELVDEADWQRRAPTPIEVLLDAALKTVRKHLQHPEPHMECGRLQALLPQIRRGAHLDLKFFGRAWSGFQELARRTDAAGGTRPVKSGQKVAALVDDYRTRHLLPLLQRKLLPQMAGQDAAFGLEIEGEPPGRLGIVIKDGALASVLPRPQGRVLFRLREQAFRAIVSGEAPPTQEFLQGRIELEGPPEEGLRLVGLLTTFFQDHPYQLRTTP